LPPLEVPEEKYRPLYLAGDIRQASICIALFLVFVAVMPIRDYNFLGLSPTFYWMLLLRAMMIGVGAFLLAYIRKVTDFRVFDRVVGIAFFAAITSVLIINTTRPGDYGLYLLVDLAAVSAIYVAVPMSLRNQVALGLYLMAGDIVVLILTKDAALRPHLYTIIPAFALVNVTGFTLSRLLHISRGREYLAREAERQATAEKEHLEKEQRRSEKLEAIGTLAGSIAHDFNNILTAVLGNICLAKEQTAPGTEMGHLLSEAEAASFRARDLNRQLITFARGGTPVKQPTYLADLVRETVKTTLDGTSVTAHIKISEILMAELDPGQFRQALKNLLANAREAMPGGGAVRITAMSEDKDEVAWQGLAGVLPAGDYISLTVSDNGPGIPEENRDKVFQPFFTTKSGASGLGLAVAYSIIKGHGGYIKYQPSETGAKFIIYLPAGIAAPEARESGATPVRQPRILLMDDEAPVRKVAARMLRRLGYDYELAGDGLDAIAQYREAIRDGNGFAAVVLDLTVPGSMGGRETLQQLHQIDPKIKALASSGYSDDMPLARCKELGFCGAVQKPYTLDQLREALEQVLGSRQESGTRLVSRT